MSWGFGSGWGNNNSSSTSTQNNNNSSGWGSNNNSNSNSNANANTNTNANNNTWSWGSSNNNSSNQSNNNSGNSGNSGNNGFSFGGTSNNNNSGNSTWGSNNNSNSNSNTNTNKNNTWSWGNSNSNTTNTNNNSSSNGWGNNNNNSSSNGWGNNNNTNTNMSSNNQTIGTKGYKFKPHKDSNNKNNKQFYYQHICVGTNRYQNKSSEELRFEDQFNSKAAPGTDQNPTNNNNQSSNAWGSNNNNASKSSNNLWGNNSNTNTNTNNTNSGNNTWSFGNNSSSNQNSSSGWGNNNSTNTNTNTNTNNNNNTWNFGGNNNKNNSNASNNNGNSNSNGSGSNSWSWNQNNSNSSFSFSNNQNKNNQTNNGSNNNSNTNNNTWSWGNSNKANTNTNTNTSNNATNTSNNNNNTWSWGNSNSSNNNTNTGSNTQNTNNNTNQTNTNNNKNTGFNWGNSNSNSNANANSNTNASTSFSWGNNNNSTSNANNNNSSFSFGNNNSSNNNSNANTNAWGSSNTNNSTSNNNTNSWNFGGNNNASNNNNKANNNNSSSNWSFNTGNNASNANNNTSGNNNNNASWNWGGNNNNSTNNSSNTNTNNNSNSGNNASWNFDWNSGNKNNTNAGNGSNASWNFGGNNGNSNQNFGPNNKNMNGPMFAKHNQNPYQIDMLDELRELNDKNSALNQSFTGQTDSYWKSSIFPSKAKTKNNINSLANSYIQSSQKRMNQSIIKLTPRNSAYLDTTKRTPIVTLKPRSTVFTHKSMSNITHTPINNPINPNNRLNQTTMILSKIIPGNEDKSGNTNTFITSFVQPTHNIRPYTSSELRRISNLGPVPKVPDLSEYYVNEDTLTENTDNVSENSGDSPGDDEGVFEVKEENDNEIKEELPEIMITSTHRTDGVLCPKLVRKGYYSVPSMKDLQNMSAKELYSIRDFTVGHELHGTVTWRGQSDVRCLDLDKIVFLQHGRIEVYPDDISDKPKQDELLNKSAVIRLNEILPPKTDENGNEDSDLTEEQFKTAKINYGKKLQEHCKKNDCEFIKYDTKQGIWEFSVRHFTIYGLPSGKSGKVAPKKAAKKVQKPMQAPLPMNGDVDNDDVRSQNSHATSHQFPDMNNSVFQQSQYGGNLGLNEFKNRDIADSFSALINAPPRQANDHMIVDDNNNDNIRYDHESEQLDDDESVYDAIDDTHEEMPSDTIIFHENVMQKQEQKEAPISAANAEISNDKYYPTTTILRKPNPLSCANEIATEFEKVLKAELDATLEQSAHNKYKQQNDDENDFVMSNQPLSEYQNIEFGRKMMWESYDLGFRNQSMFNTLLKSGKLYTVMRRQYFEKDKIAYFNELKESNSIQVHSVISGLEKILGHKIYLGLINKLLTVHKQYYFDQKQTWNTTECGDKLQDLSDAYCDQIQYMLSFLQNKENEQIVLGKTVLTTFNDALKLILALYAPRCGAGPQSNLKIPSVKDTVSHMTDKDVMNVETESYEYDDDSKMDTITAEISYNELFARKVNISQWLEGVIREEVDAELLSFDQEIEKIKGIIANNEDEKQEMISSNAKDAQITRWNDEKIFVCLTANRKAQACELAISQCEYRLASLISQSSHFAAASEKYQPFIDLREQIDYWKKHKIWETFNEAKRKIYALLAGRYVEIVFNAKFNWFRCFGVILWFYLPIHWTLNECLIYFDSVCKMEKYPFTLPTLDIKQKCKDIHKRIRERQNESISNNPLSTVIASMFTREELKDKFANDICYDLLQMKCTNPKEFNVFENIFNPRNIGPFKLEYMFHWFIHDLLLETGQIQITNEKQSQISANVYHSFVEQLERMGYWHWAIYLALFADKNRKNNEENGWLRYDYSKIANLILQRNINKSIPLGFDAKLVKQTQHLTDMTFRDLVKNKSDKREMDIDENENGTPLPTHYTYCDNSETFYNDYLHKFWINVLDDTIINGLKFLVHIDGERMEKWIIYCLAEYAESMGNWIVAYLSYSKCLEWNKVHQILMNHLFVDWLFEDKIDGHLINTLQSLDGNKSEIHNWKENGMILFHYIKVMRDIQHNPQQNIETNLNRIRKVKGGISKMLDCLNDGRIEASDNESESEEEEDNEELKKRVCLMTMQQRLDTCVVHLTQK